MPAVVTDKFRIKNAQSFLERADGSYNTAVGSTTAEIYYVTIGKDDSWPVDGTPPIPDDSHEETQIDVYRNMWVGKKVTAANACIVIPRNIWTSGVIYSMYDSAEADLYRTRFFVVNSAKRVYKCLYRPTGTASTVEPTSVSTTPFTGADGYTWKYMFQINDADDTAFTTTSFIPCRVFSSDPGYTEGTEQYNIQNAAVSGALYAATVAAGGSGYNNASAVTITGDGTGAAASVTTSGGAITKVVFSSVGSGYTYATISVADGTGADLRAIISPQGGHGKNAVEELGGYYVSISQNFISDEAGEVSVDNDFRQVAILRNPSFNSGSSASDPLVRQTTRLTYAVTSGSVAIDQTITQAGTGATGRVVTYNPTNLTMDLSDVVGTFNASGNITGTGPSLTATVSACDNPGFTFNSGQILYVDYRAPITRQADQTERVRIVIEF